MMRYQHAAPAVDAIFYDNKVIVAGELVLVYAVQTTLLRRAAKAVAIRQEACILGEISCRSRGTCSTSSYSASLTANRQVGRQTEGGRGERSN